MFDLSSYLTKSKHYYDLNKVVVGEMKNKTACVTYKEFIGLKPKMYSFLVDGSNEHKKVNVVNKNVVATIIHNEYKNVMLNNK